MCALECTCTHQKNYVIHQVFLKFSLDIWKILPITLASLCKQRGADSSAQKPCLFSHPSATWKYWKDHGLTRKETQVFEIILFYFSSLFSIIVEWVDSINTSPRINSIIFDRVSQQGLAILSSAHMCTDTYMHACLCICVQVYVYIYTYGTLALGCKERYLAFPAYFVSSEAPTLRQPSKPTLCCPTILCQSAKSVRYQS